MKLDNPGCMSDMKTCTRCKILSYNILLVLQKPRSVTASRQQVRPATTVASSSRQTVATTAASLAAKTTACTSAQYVATTPPSDVANQVAGTSRQSYATIARRRRCVKPVSLSKEHYCNYFLLDSHE